MIALPKLLAFFSSVFVSVITLAFLNFLPEISLNILFVAGISSFFSTFFFTYYTIDILVFKEINKIYTSVQNLKIKNFDIARKTLLKNVNPIKKLNLEIFNYVSSKQEEIEELKRMENFRREFLADVSHELKTPIFAAQGFVHTLIDGAINDPKVSGKFLKKAAKSLDGLDVLVRDLLVLTQVESGDLKMNLSPVNLIELIDEIVDQLEDNANKRHIKISLKSKDQYKCIVWADKLRMYQVFINLIDNAIKYGKENGSILIELSENSKFISVAIEDNGLGISKEQLPRIFERFYRIDKSRSRDTGGTGLGLAIVKHLLNAHDSIISVSSKLDKGTRFTFQLAKPPK